MASSGTKSSARSHAVDRRRDRRVLAVSGIVLATAGGAAAAIATGAVDAASRLAFGTAIASVVAGVVATGAVLWNRSAGSPRLVAISPFAIAAATWLVLFGLRPVELYFAPSHAAISLAMLGFDLSDLTRGVAIGGLGIAAWGAGYLIAFGALLPRAAELPRSPRTLHVSGRAGAIVLAVGTLLWFALFMRQGGPRALIQSAASIRSDQTSSFYAFIGVWMINGVALYAVLALLRRPTKVAKRLLLAASLLAVAASVCLEVRGPLAFTALACVALYLEARRPSRVRLVAGIVVALVGAVVLLAMAQFRTYSSNYSTDEALTLLVQTPPSAYTVSDLSTFDNLVAIRELVPSSVPYLDGESFKWIPELLVPRALWHGKPLGLDFLASAYFYPGVLVGTPVSLQGELYWNDGLWTVAGGAFVVGALMGMLGRWGLTRARGRGGFVLYVVALTSTHAFLTRSLAIMTSSLVLALIGSAIAVAATGRWSPRTAVAATLARLRRGDRRPAPSPVQP